MVGLGDFRLDPRSGAFISSKPSNAKEKVAIEEHRVKLDEMSGLLKSLGDSVLELSLRVKVLEELIDAKLRT